MQGAQLKMMGVLKPGRRRAPTAWCIRLDRRGLVALLAAQPGRRPAPRRRRRGRMRRRALSCWRKGRGGSCACRSPVQSGACSDEHRAAASLRDPRTAQGDQEVRRRAGDRGVDFALRTARSTPGRRERRRQVDADQGDGRRRHAHVPGRCWSRAERSTRARRTRRCSCGIAMVFQETSLVPTMTVAQNLFLGQEHYFNRLRGIYIAAQQFLQSLKFDVDPTAHGGPARRGEEADGRDRARGAAQGAASSSSTSRPRA